MDPLRNQEITNREIERWYRLRNLRKAAQVFVIIAIVVMVAGYAVFRFIKPSQPVKDPDPKAINTVQKPYYSFPGPHPFDVRAEEALVSESQDKIILKSPKITYHPNRGGNMVLTAKTGELNRTTQNYSVKGDVNLKSDNFRIEAGQLGYSRKKNLASTTSQITIKAKNMLLKGKQLKFWPDKKEAHIEQNVEATLFNINIFNTKNHSSTQNREK
jgi:LPS export ABC transporter protein LptC